MIASIPSTLGTLPGWLTLFGVIALAWSLRGAAGGQALSAVRDQRDELAAQLKRNDDENAELKKRVATLETKTDIALALAPMMKWAESHERNATERHKSTISAGNAQLAILEMIAQRLGPDPNGGSTDG